MSKKFISIFLMLTIAIIITGCGSKSNSNKVEKEKIKIVESETSKLEYEEFNNGLISMQIPKGWKVDIPNRVTYSGYTFKLYNPNNKDYTVLFSLGFSGFLKSEAARKKYASLYPSSAFGQLPALDPKTTERFFKVWNTSAKVGNKAINQDFFEPLNNFDVIENLGKSPLGGDIIRAKFKSTNGNTLQGLFTTSIYDSGSYYMYGLDLAPLSTYHNIMMYAPDSEFVNWQAIYDHCLGSIQFSEDFMTGFNREQSSKVSTVKANAKIYDEISDMIMDSWNKRSNSYDIISQKQSDATLGYERVYDTETGDVYKAYNGFTDDYQGERYKIVTDDMYTSSISGYIEK